MALIQQAIFGLVTGSYIAIAAIGFTLVYGIINMLNIAYGEYLTIGAYIGFVGLQANLPLGAVLVAGVGVTAVVGLILTKLFFRPIVEKGPIPLLITSVGVGIVVRNGIRIVSGNELRYLDVGPPTVYRFDVLGGFFVNTKQLLVVGSALGAFLVVHLLLTRTRVGVAMRAMKDNESLSRINGVYVMRIRNVVWLLACGLGGLAGVLIGAQTAASPLMGFQQLLVILAAAILGGAGSAYGAIVGAYALGLVIELSIGLLPAWASQLGTTMAFLVLVAVLLLRPGGVTGQEVTKV
jgi:branched-subunit amino acid ABC-type transport system permease component